MIAFGIVPGLEMEHERSRFQFGNGLRVIGAVREQEAKGCSIVGIADGFKAEPHEEPAGDWRGAGYARDRRIKESIVFAPPGFLP